MVYESANITQRESLLVILKKIILLTLLHEINATIILTRRKLTRSEINAEINAYAKAIDIKQR